MLKKLQLPGITWIDGVNLSHKEIEKVLSPYDFHELDIESVLEQNQRARIDNYEKYIFLTLHFPKYIPYTQTYKLNEFHIFLGKDFLITLRNFSGKHLEDIYSKYEQKGLDDEYNIDTSPGLILYELIQEMLEKMFRVSQKEKSDISQIERKVFQKAEAPLVRDILIKKRNIITLKHMFQPQKAVLVGLEDYMKQAFSEEIEAYYEDLEDKLQRIITDILVLEEQIISVEDALTSLINIQTNSIIKFLTIFSAFMLPLTFVTSFYGMNIKLPFQDVPFVAYASMLISVGVLSSLYFYVQKKRKI